MPGWVGNNPNKGAATATSNTNAAGGKRAGERASGGAKSRRPRDIMAKGTLASTDAMIFSFSSLQD